MKSFFIKFIYYTYVGGLILLLLDILGFLFTKGNFLGTFSLLQAFVPLAGLSGLIPVALIFFFIVTGHLYFLGFAGFFLPYIFLPFAIILQRKIINRIKQAVNYELKKDYVFKVIILHHLWTNVAVGLVIAYNINFLLRELGPAHFSFSRFLFDPISIGWSCCMFLNFLLAFGVWRWTKVSE